MTSLIVIASRNTTVLHCGYVCLLSSVVERWSRIQLKLTKGREFNPLRRQLLSSQLSSRMEPSKLSGRALVSYESQDNQRPGVQSSQEAI
ncbi:hypothetical protein OUZ56_014115 [Daphnia magna]|uniref:Uncharacterized protein n=1 Tax=Daphnia magna TaxID=35525 RepID=A0ABQ9Z7Y3_9CRUS|nr:hypothetical protein OUZ56_014115 [Daphnia magna]